MHIRGPKEFPYGYTAISTMDNVQQHSLMDFGILRMKKGDVFSEAQHLERAYLLVNGKAKLTFEETEAVIERGNCFDFEPWVLHVPNDVEVVITALDECEWTVHRTDNENIFPSKCRKIKKAIDNRENPCII